MLYLSLTTFPLPIYDIATVIYVSELFKRLFCYLNRSRTFAECNCLGYVKVTLIAQWGFQGQKVAGVALVGVYMQPCVCVWLCLKCRCVPVCVCRIQLERRQPVVELPRLLCDKYFQGAATVKFVA